MNNCGFGTKDIENKSRFKDFNLTKQFCPVTDRYLHFCAFTIDCKCYMYLIFKAQDAAACSKCDRFSQPEDLMFLPPLLVYFLLLFLRSRFMIFDCPTREKRVSIIIRL